MQLQYYQTWQCVHILHSQGTPKLGKNWKSIAIAPKKASCCIPKKCIASGMLKTVPKLLNSLQASSHLGFYYWWENKNLPITLGVSSRMQEEQNQSKIRRWSVTQGRILDIIDYEIIKILIAILHLAATGLWKSYLNTVSFCFLTCKSGFIKVPTSKRTASKSAPRSERGRSKSGQISNDAEKITFQ